MVSLIALFHKILKVRESERVIERERERERSRKMGHGEKLEGKIKKEELHMLWYLYSCGEYYM